MRKFAVIAVCIIALSITMTPIANADAGQRAKNVGKNIGRAIFCPIKAVGRVIKDTGEALAIKKAVDVPLAPLRIVKHSVNDVRQESFDVAESVGRAVAAKEMIPLEDVGTGNTKITEAGLDGVVDAVVAGAVTGVIVHNANMEGATQHVGKAVATAVGIVAGSNLADDAAGDEKK